MGPICAPHVSVTNHPRSTLADCAGGHAHSFGRHLWTTPLDDTSGRHSHATERSPTLHRAVGPLSGAPLMSNVRVPSRRVHFLLSRRVHLSHRAAGPVPIENVSEHVSGPDFSRPTGIRAARPDRRQPSAAMSRSAGKRSIKQRVPSRSRVPSPPANPLARALGVAEAHSRSTISVVHVRMASAVARRAHRNRPRNTSLFSFRHKTAI